MYQNFQQDAVITAHRTECNDCNTDCNTDVTECNEKTYSVEEIAQLLNIKERQVYNLAKTLISAWYWLPESEIRTNGIYTQFALNQMKRLKACKNSTEYKNLVAQENQKPITPTAKATPTINTQLLSTSTLVLPTRKVDILESKLATIQNNQAAQNISIQDRVKLALTRINEEKQRSANNTSALDDARKQAVVMKATQDALEEHEIYQQVKNAVKEQLTLEELGQ